MIQQKRNLPTVQDDEVDLISILVRLIEIVKSYALRIVLFTVIGILAGYVMYLIQQPIYESRLIANSAILQNQEVIAIVASWQQHINHREMDLLNKELGLPEKILRKVYLLEAEESKANADGLIITTKVGDNTVLPDLQKAIVNSFENKRFVRERVSVKRKNLKLLLTQVNGEIAHLEQVRSLMQNLLENTNKQNASSLMIDLGNTGNINLQLIGLFEKRLTIEEQLEFLDDFQIIEGFTASTTPSSPKLLKNIAVGGFLGLIAAFALVIFQLLRQKVNAHEKYYGT